MDGYYRLDTLVPHPKNYRHGDVEGIIESIATFGFNGALRVWRDGIVLAGNHSYKALKAMYERHMELPVRVRLDSDGMWLAPCIDLSDLDEKKALAYVAADNRLSDLAYNDEAQLLELIREVDDSAIARAAGYTEDDIADLESLLSGMEDEESPPEGKPKILLAKEDIPDAIWPSNDAWGVPLLDLAYQADAVHAPIAKWGTVARNSAMPGTYHFYTDDYKFDGLWGNFAPLVNSGCRAVVEANFSTNRQMPRAVVLYNIFRKRYMSRWWQSKGLKIFVDMNVEPEFEDLALLGVPQGWRAYANRAYHDDIEHLEWAYAQAKARCGAEPFYFVIGGRAMVRDLCRRRGWTWVAEDISRIHREKVAEDGLGGLR